MQHGFERLLHALGLIIGEGLLGSPNATVRLSNELINLEHPMSEWYLCMEGF